jgi:hypothetical protein
MKTLVLVCLCAVVPLALLGNSANVRALQASPTAGGQLRFQNVGKG